MTVGSATSAVALCLFAALNDLSTRRAQKLTRPVRSWHARQQARLEEQCPLLFDKLKADAPKPVQSLAPANHTVRREAHTEPTAAGKAPRQPQLAGAGGRSRVCRSSLMPLIPILLRGQAVRVELQQPPALVAFGHATMFAKDYHRHCNVWLRYVIREMHTLHL
jgi:hypothetical protein